MIVQHPQKDESVALRNQESSIEGILKEQYIEIMASMLFHRKEYDLAAKHF